MSKIFQTVANSKPLLITAGIIEVLSIIEMSRRTEYLQSNFNPPFDPPDLWFGIPEEKLYNYLDEIGDGGREAYRRMNSWDLFPYMESYMIFCGALLFIQCRTANTHDVSWIFFITMLCDIVESGSFNYALNQYPEHLSSKIMTAASIANQMKWISFGIGGVILVGLLMNNHILGRSKAKAHQK